MEESVVTATGKIVVDGMGRVHSVVFFADIWLANGILQLRGLARTGDVTGNRIGASRRRWCAVVDESAGCGGGGRSAVGRCAEYGAGDFCISAGAWGYFVSS